MYPAGRSSHLLTTPACSHGLALQEVLRPLQLSLDTKSDRLKSRALAITQNLIANHALPAEASEAVVAMLGRVDRNTDENVQLKTLQTALTLLQSPLRPCTEEQIGAVLGVCLRLTNKKGHKDAVLTTAAATVRQAVALVLSYVDVEAELQGQQLQGRGEASAPGGAATAAQKLVEDLCNIASGGFVSTRRGTVTAGVCGMPMQPLLWRSTCASHARQPCLFTCAGAPPLWLKSPSLPRTFVLELLEFLLVNSPSVFRQLPSFQNALAVRMTQLIQAQLQVGRLGDSAWQGCSNRCQSCAQVVVFSVQGLFVVITHLLLPIDLTWAQCRIIWMPGPLAPPLPPQIFPRSVLCFAWHARSCATSTRFWAPAAARWSRRCWQVGALVWVVGVWAEAVGRGGGRCYRRTLICFRP